MESRMPPRMSIRMVCGMPLIVRDQRDPKDRKVSQGYRA